MGCAQFFLFVFVTVFHGEIAGTSHGALSEAMFALTISGFLWLTPVLTHLYEAGFIVYDRFQAYC